jgi:hypothetical protein
LGFLGTYYLISSTRKPTGSPKKLPGSPQEGTKNFRAEIQK